jgi:uncharacterized protein with HEPN domain
VSAKDPRVRLQHILDQIDGIEAATRGLTYENIIDNFIYERAVERAVQIISEAAKELPEVLRQKYPNVHWRPIIGVGNLLRHEYYRINAREMWDIVQVHLPELRPVIVQMVRDLS